jgi:hypothetical protein
MENKKYKYSIVKIDEEDYSIRDYTNKKEANEDCKELNARYGFKEYIVVNFDNKRN